MKKQIRCLFFLFAFLFVAFVNAGVIYAVPQMKLKFYDPATKQDIDSYKAGISVNLEINAPEGKTFPEAYGVSKIPMEVRITAYDGIVKVAEFTSNLPSAGDGVKTNMHIWVDPSDTKTEIWPETNGYKNYVFIDLKEPKVYKLVLDAYVNLYDDKDKMLKVGSTSMIWDISGGNKFKEWNLALQGIGRKNTLSKAVMHDAAIEAQMKSLLRTVDGISVIKLVITHNWNIERNYIGQIVQREIYGEFVHKKDGEYWIQEAAFKQDYIGGSWGSLKLNGWGGRKVLTTEDQI